MEYLLDENVFISCGIYKLGTEEENKKSIADGVFEVLLPQRLTWSLSHWPYFSNNMRPRKFHQATCHVILSNPQYKSSICGHIAVAESTLVDMICMNLTNQAVNQMKAEILIGYDLMHLVHVKLDPLMKQLPLASRSNHKDMLACFYIFLTKPSVLIDLTMGTRFAIIPAACCHFTKK
ncbi:unnamed protein product [Citrullus colocynthis]|uniref:DUF4411 family protein n=1 Tax=Citrullus colocynthis TaxID=252529 RepID=A0ABP0Z3Y5_9ROSI